MLGEVSSYLVANGVTGTVYGGFMPEAPDNCICLYETSGQSPLMTHDGQDILRPGLQVMVRNNDYATGRAIAETVKERLNRVTNQIVGGRFYLSVRANHEPAHLGVDQNSRHRWSLNFAVQKGR